MSWCRTHCRTVCWYRIVPYRAVQPVLTVVQLEHVAFVPVASLTVPCHQIHLDTRREHQQAPGKNRAFLYPALTSSLTAHGHTACLVASAWFNEVPTHTGSSPPATDVPMGLAQKRGAAARAHPNARQIRTTQPPPPRQHHQVCQQHSRPTPVAGLSQNTLPSNKDSTLLSVPVMAPCQKMALARAATATSSASLFCKCPAPSLYGQQRAARCPLGRRTSPPVVNINCKNSSPHTPPPSPA